MNGSHESRAAAGLVMGERNISWHFYFCKHLCFNLNFNSSSKLLNLEATQHEKGLELVELGCIFHCGAVQSWEDLSCSVSLLHTEESLDRKSMKANECFGI